jgi:hypothetical protein
MTGELEFGVTRRRMLLMLREMSANIGVVGDDYLHISVHSSSCIAFRRCHICMASLSPFQPLLDRELKFRD